MQLIKLLIVTAVAVAFFAEASAGEAAKGGRVAIVER